MMTKTDQSEHACTAMFEWWLSWELGTEEKDRTWQTVLSAVEYAGPRPSHSNSRQSCSVSNDLTPCSSTELAIHCNYTYTVLVYCVGVFTVSVLYIMFCKIFVANCPQK